MHRNTYPDYIEQRVTSSSPTREHCVVNKENLKNPIRHGLSAAAGSVVNYLIKSILEVGCRIERDSHNAFVLCIITLLASTLERLLCVTRPPSMCLTSNK